MTHTTKEKGFADKEGQQKVARDAKGQNHNFMMLLRLENTGPSSVLTTTVMKQLRAETIVGKSIVWSDVLRNVIIGRNMFQFTNANQ